MAIFFGDELRSSNSDYPIIDIAENNAKGVIFVDSLADFTNVNIPEPKIGRGVIVVNRASGDVYMYTLGFTNSDGSGGTTTGNNYVDSETLAEELNKWFSLGTGTIDAAWKVIGNTPVFDSDIYANIGTIGDIVDGTKRTFGKYENGDLIPTSTKTALEVIKDALTSYQDFVSSDIDDISSTAGDEEVIPYAITGRTGVNAVSVLDRGFRIRNRNRNSIPENPAAANNTSAVPYGIHSIQVDRTGVDAETNVGKIEWSGTAWTKTGVLNTADAETAINTLNSFIATPETSYVSFSFDDSVDINAYTGGDGEVTGKYTIKVIALDDDGQQQGYVVEDGPGIAESLTVGDEARGRFVVSGYLNPTVSLTVAIADSSESGTAGFTDTNNERSLGNVDSDITLTVQKRESVTSISKIKVYRGSVATGTLLHEITDEAGPPANTVAIDASQNGATQPSVTYNLKDYLDSTGVTGYGSKDMTIPDADVNSISYSVEIEDDGGSTGTNSENYSGSTISFKIPFFAGYSSTNPASSNGTVASAAAAILSGGAFLKKTNSSGGDFLYKASPSISSIGSAPISTGVSDDIYVTPGDITGNYVYICLPNTLELSDISENGSEPVISDFGGTTGKQASMTITFSNSTSRNYRLYGNGQDGGFSGSVLDIS